MQHENKVKMDTKTAITNVRKANGKHGEPWADYSEDVAPATEKGKKGKKGKGGGKGGKQDKVPPPPKPATDGGAQQKPELRSKAEMAEFCRFF